MPKPEMFNFKNDPKKDFEENIKENQENFNNLSEDEQKSVIARDKTNAERIEKIRNEKYDNKSEYKIDPESPEAKEKIKEAQELYRKFAEEFENVLNLDKTETIGTAYDRAKKLGLMKKAEEMRELFFGKDMHFYGVVYTCDHCMNNCAYCPFAAIKREAQAIMNHGIEDLTPNEQEKYLKILDGEPIEPPYAYKNLNINQVVQETIAVMDKGHTHVCYLEGSPSKLSIDNGTYAKRISDFVAGIIKGTKVNGLEEIILNIEPLTTEGFKTVREATDKANEECGTHVTLQFRVFQETYNKEIYKQFHDQNPNMPKSDYENRLKSQERALEAGFDEVGFGTLFNLNAHPIEEIGGS